MPYNNLVGVATIGSSGRAVPPDGWLPGRHRQTGLAGAHLERDQILTHPPQELARAVQDLSLSGAGGTPGAHSEGWYAKQGAAHRYPDGGFIMHLLQWRFGIVLG